MGEKGYHSGCHRENDGLPYWSLVKEGAAEGAMRAVTENPLCNNHGLLAAPGGHQGRWMVFWTPVKGIGLEFEHTFPAYSLTILRMRR